MNFKVFFMMTLLYLSLLWAFITDFFHDYSWMSTTVQYVPMALVWLIIIVLAILEVINKVEKKKTADEEEGNKSIFMKMFSLLLLWAIVIAMNFMVGEPRMNLLNIYSPEFWFFLILIPLFTLFNYKRKTDGV